MLRSLLILSLIFQSPVGFAKTPKVKKASKIAPFTHYEAGAAAEFFKLAGTYNGLLTYLEKYIPKEEVKNLRKLMARYGVNESDYLPDFKVEGNKLRQGRAMLQIHENHLMVNNRKIKMDGRAPSEYVVEICKMLKCGKSEASLLQKSLIHEADALATWLIVGLSFLAGVVAVRLWDRWRARRAAGTSNEVVFVGPGAGATTNAVGTNPPAGAVYYCDGNDVYIQKKVGGQIQMFNQRGQRVLIHPRYLQKGKSCQEQAAIINEAVKQNEANPKTSEPPAGSRAVTGKKSKSGKKPQPKKPEAQ